MKVSGQVKATGGLESAFYRSTRSLEIDRFRFSLLGMLLVVLLVGAWLVWFFLARITRYEVSNDARLEVAQSVYRIQATVSGRVSSSHLVLGQEVQPGEILVELDSDPQRLQLEEERARMAALSPQMTAIAREIEAIKNAERQEREASTVARQQAGAQFREGEALAHVAEEEADRASRLHSEGLMAERDFMQTKAEAQRHRAAADNLQLAAGRLEREQKARESDRQAEIERLQSEITRLQGQQSVSAATGARLQHEIERRLIRAPVAGKLGQVATLRVGSFINEADDLGAVVPSGRFRVVAEFPPAAALGRIRPGQSGRLRLDGYPWTQYGSLRTIVTSVGDEIRDGRVRVELDVTPEPGCRISLQHGLPGSVEVQVEKVSPAVLVARVAGRLIAVPQKVSGSGEAGTSAKTPKANRL